MKNIIKIIVLSISIFYVSQINAQTFGLHTEIEIGSDIIIEDNFLFIPILNDFKIFGTYKIGPSVDFKLSDRLFLTTGLWGTFSPRKSKGLKEERSHSHKEFNAEIPALFRFSTGHPRFRFYGQFGSSLIVQIHSKFEGQTNSNSIILGESFSNFIWSNQIGFGFESRTIRFGVHLKDYMLN